MDCSAEQTTRSKILDLAERLVQARGFNGFSYADIADELQVTTAAIHYHFSGKAQLAEALVQRYIQRFETALKNIEGKETSFRSQIEAYVEIYGQAAVPLRHARGRV